MGAGAGGGKSYGASADLRPMSIGEVLDRTFSLYRNNFWLFVGITAWPFLLQLVFNLAVAALPLVHKSAAGGAAAPHSLSATAAVVGSAAVVGIIGLILYLGLTGAAQAATVFAVSDLYLGRTTSIAKSFQSVRGYIGTVLGVMFLTGLVVGIGFILLIVPGFIVLARTAVGVPVAMLEDTGPMDSLHRSAELTKDFAMPILLIFLLVFTMAIVGVVIFQVPFTVLAALRPHSFTVGLLIFQQLATFLSQVLVAPIGSIAFCLMYYNLRVRKEAFDLTHLIASLGPASAEGLPASEVAQRKALRAGRLCRS